MGLEFQLRENIHEFTVSELSFALKRQIEENFSHVRVRGEIGRISRPASGHLYLDLKDDRSVLAAVIWKGVAASFRIKPEQGLEVIATGRLTTFPGKSTYQLVIEHLEPAGIGALMALLDERRKKLAAEGLFDVARKKPLPFLPGVVGVVTSPSGAVIRDILHRLADRFPRHVLVWPVLVQGERAAAEIAAAIEGFNRLSPLGPVPRPDLLIVARGGGSLEDLWAFNEEIVVRAAAASAIPLIAAVGHETDTTLIDFAADRRAPTPTAAAEMAVPVRAELLAQLLDRAGRLLQAQSRFFSDRDIRLQGLSRALPKPQDLLGVARQRADFISQRLLRALYDLVGRRERALAAAGGRLRPQIFRRELRTHQTRLADLGRRMEQSIRGRLERTSTILTSVRLNAALQNNLRSHEAQLARVRVRLRAGSILGEITRWRLQADDRFAQLQSRAKHRLANAEQQLSFMVRHLNAVSYHAVLERGFALVRRLDGSLVRRRSEAHIAEILSIEFRDGRVEAVIGEPKPLAKRPGKGPGQGELF